MRRKVFCLLLMLSSPVLFAQNKGTNIITISGTTLPPATGNLLTGCTVKSDDSGMLNCVNGNVVPSGWNVLQMESFERCSGSSCPYDPHIIFWGGVTISPDRKHAGSKAVTGYAISMKGTPSQPPMTDVYVSFWQWMNAGSHTFHELWLAALWAVSTPNSTVNIVIDQMQPTLSGCGQPDMSNSKDNTLTMTAQDWTQHQQTVAYPKCFYPGYDGAWHQYEIWIHPGPTMTRLGLPNNSTTGQCSGKVWRDGVLYLTASNINCTASYDFNANWAIEIGGSMMQQPVMSRASYGSASCPSSPPIVCASSWSDQGAECGAKTSSTPGKSLWGTGPNINGLISGSSNPALNGTPYCSKGTAGFPNAAPSRTYDDVIVLYK